MTPSSGSTAKQMGTRWGSLVGVTVARRATLAWSNLRLASCSFMRTALSLAGGLLQEVDGLVDPVEMGAVAQDGDAQSVSAADGRAGEEDVAAGVDLVEDAGAVGVVEGDDGELRLPGQLEVV